MRRRTGALSSIKVGFGVDFGHRLLKAILMEESYEGVVVRAAGAVPMPPGSFNGDKIADRRRVASMLRQLCQAQGISPRRGRFSIPTSSLSIRWIDIPPVPDDDLDEVAAFQAQRYFSVPAGDGYQALVPIHAHEDSETRPYILVSTSKEVIESRAQVMEAAGIEPVSADIQPFSILRALEGLFQHGGVFWRNQSLTFMEMGALSTEMYVVRDMALRFVRAIPFGGRDIALKLAEERGCTETEAFALIESPTATLDVTGDLRTEADGHRISLNMESVFIPLVKEVHRLLTYYRSLFPERSYAGILDRVYFCGGMASLKGLDAFLGTALGVTIHTVNPFSQVLAKFNIQAFESVSHKEHAFTGTMGLATADLSDAPEGEGARSSDSDEFLWTRTA